MDTINEDIVKKIHVAYQSGHITKQEATLMLVKLISEATEYLLQIRQMEVADKVIKRDTKLLNELAKK
jgi:hypothetical protein